MLERLHYLATELVNSAFETTLASRTFAPWIDDLRKTGYICHLVFLWLPSPEFAIARVQERVRMGGHNVPEDIIRRRYNAGVRNFFQLYQPLTESWRFYDNSDPSKKIGTLPNKIRMGAVNASHRLTPVLCDGFHPSYIADGMELYDKI